MRDAIRNLLWYGLILTIGCLLPVAAVFCKDVVLYMNGVASSADMVVTCSTHILLSGELVRG